MTKRFWFATATSGLLLTVVIANFVDREIAPMVVSWWAVGVLFIGIVDIWRGGGDGTV